MTDTMTITAADFARLSRLADRQDILQLSIDYMRGLDRLDKALLASVYHEDATDHRGFLNGPASGLVDFAIDILSTHKMNHHMIGQADIDIDGDMAFGEIYFQAYHLVDVDGTDHDFIIGGRYIDRYERRGGVWKIAHRSELNDYCSNVPATNRWFEETPQALRGHRGAEDLSSQRARLRSL